MAVQHPIAGILCDKFDIPRLRHAQKHRVSWAPGRRWLSSSFCARDYKLMAVKVDRMVVHPQIDQADADALSMTHNKRGVAWTRFSVEGHPAQPPLPAVRACYIA